MACKNKKTVVEQQIDKENNNKQKRNYQLSNAVSSQFNLKNFNCKNDFKITSMTTKRQKQFDFEVKKKKKRHNLKKMKRFNSTSCLLLR